MRSVPCDLRLDARRQQRVVVSKRNLDAPDEVADVGARFLRHTEQHRRISVVAGVQPTALEVVVHFCDVTEADVGAVGVLTIMTISVTERTTEIGLLRALGARRGQIRSLFLSEAILLSGLGGLLGLCLGIGIAQLLKLGLPALPVNTPWMFVALAEVIAVVIGLAAGVIPASRAARLDPVEALRAE